MSVSFVLYKASGQRFDPLPGHDDREFSLSNANAADVLDALGIEDSFSERPWPIPCFRALLIVARRKRLGHASRHIPVTETRKPGTMLVIDCGRAEGYIEQRLAQLSDLVNEGIEIGATRVGWGQPPILRPTTERCFGCRASPLRGRALLAAFRRSRSP